MELLISIAIFTLISISIFTLTNSTFNSRDKMLNDSDFYNTIRLSISIMDKDIALLYSPRIILPPSELPQEIDPKTGLPITTPVNNRADGADGKSGDQNKSEVDIEAEMQKLFDGEQQRVTQYWGQIAHISGVRPSRFVGEAEKFSLVTASNIRIYRDSRESIFAKVAYGLKEAIPSEVSEPDERFEGTRVLYKSEIKDAFDLDNDDNEEAIVLHTLLEGIKTLKFEYFHREKDEWYNTWDSTDKFLLDKYPDAIRMTIEVVGPKSLTFDGVYYFKPEIPIYGLRSSI